MKAIVPLFFLALSAAASSPERILESLVDQGRASYLDLSRAFYGEQVEAIFAAKAAYQQAHPESDWLACYGSAARVVPFLRLPVSSPAWKRGADGTYDSRHDRIYFKEGAAVAVSDAIHELGHSIQREAVYSQGPRYQAALRRINSRVGWGECNSIRYPEPVARLAGKAPRFSGHAFVEYVCRKVELEIRAQAMNRYYFAKTGRAIGSPDEARECLALAEVEQDEVNLRRYREVFELIKIRALINTVDGVRAADAFWEALIYLAPGHA